MTRTKLMIVALAGSLLGAAPAMALPVAIPVQPGMAPTPVVWHHKWHHHYARRHMGGNSHSYTAFDRRLNGVPCGIKCRHSHGD